MVNFTSICTSFTYQDMKKYDKIYQDKVLGEMDRTLVNTRKIEVIPKYAKKSKSVLRLPRQYLYFTYQTVQNNRISVAVGM